MFPRWLGLILFGILLVLAGFLLAPLIPVAALAAFVKWALILIGAGAIIYGAWLKLAGGPRARDPRV